MEEKSAIAPDQTAVRVALWRAMHLEVDRPPHIIEDEIGLKLADPEDGWRNRPDMHAANTSLFRASIVARARFIEDLVVSEAGRGVEQYVILGAGLDSFAQRRPEAASRLTIYEVDRPETQAWKRQRLNELGLGVPEYLRFVPVDFEVGDSWVGRVQYGGFDITSPAVVVSTGVSIYLTTDAIAATLREAAQFAPDSTFAMTYLLPIEYTENDERIGREFSEKGARASGTPFISFFTGEQMVEMALEAGFKKAYYVTAADLSERYFTDRKDDLRLGRSEEFLIATT